MLYTWIASRIHYNTVFLFASRGLNHLVFSSSPLESCSVSFNLLLYMVPESEQGQEANFERAGRGGLLFHLVFSYRGCLGGSFLSICFQFLAWSKAEADPFGHNKEPLRLMDFAETNPALPVSSSFSSSSAELFQRSHVISARHKVIHNIALCICKHI